MSKRTEKRWRKLRRIESNWCRYVLGFHRWAPLVSRLHLRLETKGAWIEEAPNVTTTFLHIKHILRMGPANFYEWSTKAQWKYILKRWPNAVTCGDGVAVYHGGHLICL